MTETLAQVGVHGFGTGTVISMIIAAVAVAGLVGTLFGKKVEVGEQRQQVKTLWEWKVTQEAASRTQMRDLGLVATQATQALTEIRGLDAQLRDLKDRVTANHTDIKADVERLHGLVYNWINTHR